MGGAGNSEYAPRGRLSPPFPPGAELSEGRNMGRRTTPVELGARTVDASSSPTAARPPGDRGRGAKPAESAARAATEATRSKRRTGEEKSDALEPILRNLLAH